MINLKQSLPPLLLVLIFFSSCIPQSKVEYLQNPTGDLQTYSLPEVNANIIKPNDEIYITVTSIDDPVFNFLGAEGADNQNGLGNELSLSLISYSVNLAGEIEFPIIGKVMLSGLTLEEARLKLEEALQGYLNQPSVKIKFAYKKISVIGEVQQPGNFTYAKDQLTLLEALSLAGDLTIHGDRKEVYIIRKQKDNVAKIRVDLTDDAVVLTDYYYVKPDDVIYVRPRNSMKWSVVSTPISLVFSTITTGMLILNYFDTGGNNGN